MLLCRAAQITAALLLAGTAVVRLLASGTGLTEVRAWRRLEFGSWCALLLTGALQLWLTAAEMSGLPLGQACAGRVLASVLGGTSFGAVWQVRASLLVGTGIALAVRRTATAPAVLAIVGVVLPAVLLANLVWSGHAQASSNRAWLLPADLAHVIAAGAWPGGLLPLTLLLARARRHPEIMSSAITITRRFSRLSFIAVNIVTLSGLLNSYGLVGMFSALWPSTYGRLLVCKVTFFAGMVCLGGANRYLLTPTNSLDTPGTVRHLWRNVAWECILAIVVLVTTESLAMNAPPAMMQPPRR